MASLLPSEEPGKLSLPKINKLGKIVLNQIRNFVNCDSAFLLHRRFRGSEVTPLIANTKTRFQINAIEIKIKQKAIS